MRKIKFLTQISWWLILIIGLASLQAVHAANETFAVKIGLAVNQTALELPWQEDEYLFDLKNQQAIQPSGDRLRITSNAGRLWINDSPSETDALLLVADGELLTWNEKNYRGNFLILARDNRVTLINQIALEDYLRGVLPGEMPVSWHLEALKAQAIAARTYTLTNLKRHQADGFDLCATTHCQMYVGASAERASASRAVAETAGKVLTYQGRTIAAFYYSSSGGKTSTSASIWGEEIPYLQAVADWDQNSPHQQWQRQYTWEQLQGMAVRNYPQIGRLTQLLPVAYNDGKLAKIICRGDLGEITLTGEKFRFWLSLPSSRVKVRMVYGPEPLITLGWSTERSYPEASMQNPTFPGGIEILSPPWDLFEPYSWLRDKEPQFLLLEGSGWGHGVGLSQWGAKEMAGFGYRAEQILEHYYPGTALMNLQDLPQIKNENSQKGYVE